MGVQGLTGFLEGHQKVYQEDVHFCRSRLVIDGCNLNYHLYFSAGLDENHGGEYSAFERVIERFISSLRTCGIIPYVVLDGGSDVSDKKLETSMRRFEEKIQKGHKAAVSGRQMNNLPQLADLVFQQTLARLEVPMAQCFEESDQEVAALASEWKCPVLSNDSDFYIFDLPAGLLPISNFQWEKIERSSSQSYIPCRKFFSSSFCIFFGLQRQLLPTFAALAGNDYVKLSEIKWIQFVPPDIEAPHRLQGLLHWLKDFQEPQVALEAALGLMGGDMDQRSKEDFLRRLHRGMEGYQLGPSSVSRFFLHQVPPRLPALEQEVRVVPDWMLLPLTQARLSPVVLDVLRLLKVTQLNPSVELEHLPSSKQTARPIRQVLYGLLLGLGSGLQVDELDRKGLHLTRVPVRPIFSRVSRGFQLSSLQQEELTNRTQVLLEALEVNPDSLSLLPPQLKLPVAVTWFWMHRTRPAPDLSLLKALLLGLSLGNQPRPRTNEVDQELGRTRHLQNLDPDVTHALNQWQACLKHSIWLNQLLGFPLPDPDVARLYQGMLVHQLVHRIRTEGRLKAILRSDNTTMEQYCTMLSILDSLQESHNDMNRQRHHEARKNQTTNLKIIHQEEEMEKEEHIAIQVNEDLDQEEQMVVRTRYRTKERSNRSKRLELARKVERRGRNLHI